MHWDAGDEFDKGDLHWIPPSPPSDRFLCLVKICCSTSAQVCDEKKCGANKLGEERFHIIMAFTDLSHIFLKRRSPQFARKNLWNQTKKWSFLRLAYARTSCRVHVFCRNKHCLQVADVFWQLILWILINMAVSLRMSAFFDKHLLQQIFGIGKISVFRTNFRLQIGSQNPRTICVSIP